MNFIGLAAPSVCKVFTLKMGTELYPEKTEYLHILKQLSAREKFIEFCSSEITLYFVLFTLKL